MTLDRSRHSLGRITLAVFVSVGCIFAPTPYLVAGDLLRGGAAAGVSPTGASKSGGSGSTAVLGTGVLPSASDRLARTTQALTAVKAMQDAARALAASGANNLGLDPNHVGKTLPNVPNGLGLGGLQVASAVPKDLANPTSTEDASLWQGATLPTQTTAGAQTNVTVVQTAAQALLNWTTFNVGKNTTLTFDQSAGGSSVSEWVAFNKVNDPTAVPSQILGQINAAGQVYVINPNGIIFGGTSQVNTHALVASSLPINPNLIARGLLNNPDDQFLFSALALPAGGNGPTPAFTPDALPAGLTQPGDVVVQAGAKISAPTSDAHVGGRVALIGSNVTNAGTISTPDGQVILAAGQQVGLVAHSSSDPTLRGLDVYVGAVTETSGNATNAGLIDIPRGAATMVGKNVNQNGFIDSSTSVALNGRIDLLADYNAVSSGGLYSTLSAFVPTSSGTVTLGGNSITRILPELSSTDTVAGSLALASQVNLQGRTLHLSSGAQIQAPNADVTLDAGIFSLTGVSLAGGVLQLGGTPRFNFAQADDGDPTHVSEIDLDSGASIDVAGSAAVSASVKENIISVQLRGSELADSPLQRDGALRGQTVQVDIRQTGTYNGKTWVGTPLADANGYVALVQRTVGELTTNGGSVKLKAGGSVKLQSGAAIDVSGGWINYAGGVVQTTQVVSEGHVYDIAQATPDRVYTGIYTGTSTTSDSRWGATQSSTNPLPAGARYEDGYAQGGSGGSISISAPTMQLDGALQGTTVAGPHQRSALPTPSALTLAFQAQDLSYDSLPYFAPTKPDIVFASGHAKGTGTAFVLSSDLFTEDGFGRVEIDNHEGSVTLPGDVALNLVPGGALAINAANLDIEGRISAPGGTLKFEADDISLAALNVLNFVNGTTQPAVEAGRGNLTLGATASLDVAGMVVDDRATAATADLLPLTTNGGTLSIKGYNTTLASGSTLDVSGGAAVSAAGKVTYGNGGSLTVSGGQDPVATAVIGGHLSYRATATGYSGAGAKGGSISLLAPLVQVGGTSTSADTLLLSPDFFSAGGFSTFALSGLGAVAPGADRFVPAITIANGTTIAPQPLTWLAVTDSSSVALVPTLQLAGVRPAVSLTFKAVGVSDPLNTADSQVLRGDLVFEAGASIVTDPNSTVTLNGATVSLLGSISTPGGAINVSGGKDSNVLFPHTSAQGALTTVYLGPNARLSAAGTTLLTADARGYRTGSVLAGGSINVSGNLVASAGAVLDVSGATDVLDKAPSYTSTGDALNKSLTGSTMVATRVDSAGGNIELSGGQELFTQATLLGRAGGTSAQSGALTISSGRYSAAGGSAPTPLDVTLDVTQSETSFAVGTAGVGQAVAAVGSSGAEGYGHFAIDDFARGGFSALTLGGTVQFSGPLSVAAARSLTVGTAGLIYADSSVNLNAPYVALGQAFAAPLVATTIATSPFLLGAQPYHLAPVYGSGHLTVSGSLIDVGNLSLQQIGRVELLADNGDVRGDGTFNLAGDLYIRAGQVYTPTKSNFTIVAYDYRTPIGLTEAGSVKFAASGTRSLPLSAGGSIDVYATSIHQGGVLRAPLGSIALGWDGSGTAPVDLITGKSVPIAQTVALDAGGVTSVSAVDPNTGQAITVPYGVNLNGTAWIDPSGADITLGGAPVKSVKIAASELYVQNGAKIDLDGGGDLYAYRFVAGVGGSTDILASTTSFAVLPSYGADYAPSAAYAASSNLGTDKGYVNATLKVGDKIYLDGSTGLAAGYYTLLPARYALLPGAFLVTPKSAAPTGTVTAQPDGSSLVSGYRYNSLDATRTAQPLYATFEVAPQSVVLKRAQYDSFSANAYLHDKAVAGDIAVPRLPVDAGQLVLAANAAMTFAGTVSSLAPSGGRGGLVDIGSSVDIVVGDRGGSSASDTLFLAASDLSLFAAQSLLIGGVRTTTSAGETVDVTASKINVTNASAALTGSDIVLAANEHITLAPGAQIGATGTAAGSAETLVFGSATEAGSGNGVALRVSNDPTALITRVSVDASTAPALTLLGGAKLSGASVTLDSTAIARFDGGAQIASAAVSLAAAHLSLKFGDAGALQSDPGLVIGGGLLASLQSAQALSLTSYSAFDIYGTGQLGGGSMKSLTLHTSEIRGFTAGAVTLAAGTIALDNRIGTSGLGAIAGAELNGTLTFSAGAIELGQGAISIDQYANTRLVATNGVIANAAGAISSQGGMRIAAPEITGAAGASEQFTAGREMILAANGVAGTALSGGNGATLQFTGTRIDADTGVTAAAGSIRLHATSGDLTIGANAASRFDVGGRADTLIDVTRYTNAGRIDLVADAGAITVAAGSKLNLAAANGGGNGGTLSVSAPTGAVALSGALAGGAGAGGSAGSFLLDAGRVQGGDLAALNADLDAGGFTTLRDFRVRTGDISVSGSAKAHTFNLSADAGSILVSGTIDASGQTGGTISLVANGSVTLAGGALLDAAGQTFDSAGKGGAVNLEAGAETNGSVGQASAQVKIGAGSTIDLSVASNIAASTVTTKAHTAVSFPATTAGNDTITTTVAGKITFTDGTIVAIAANTPTLVAGGASVALDGDGAVTFAGSTSAGDYTGKLHLRAPQLADGSGLQVTSIDGTIRGASSIVVEGYKLYDLTGTSGEITQAVRDGVRNDAANFAGGIDATGALQAGHTGAILAGLYANQAGNRDALMKITQIDPGAEVVNRTGDLSLATTWDLSSYRFGPDVKAAVAGSGAPGVLTLRAAGNLVFAKTASLSDGFTSAAYDANLLGVGAQSWSYRLVAGADLAAADYHRVQTLAALGGQTGSLLLGKGSAALPGSADSRTSVVPGFFEAIRTGTGDIDIAAGLDVQLLNPLATIYTAGTQSAPMARFDVPYLGYLGSGALGKAQYSSSPYDAQYSQGGGNLSITSQRDIAHYIEVAGGGLQADSSKELPNNWLYRRGWIDPTTGAFGTISRLNHSEVASTTWWVDFSNFFEGVGTLGGGNVALVAGRNVSNVDAVAATNARMSAAAPATAHLVETGGGNVKVAAGEDIDGGVYYVERGSGSLTAGGSIHTNATRTTIDQSTLQALATQGQAPDRSTWMPTALFVGGAQFSVTAGGDLLLGPVANVFLQPQGINNSYYEKTYFSTYSATSSVDVVSLAGSVTIKDSTENGGSASLFTWLTNVDSSNASSYAALSQPWLRLAESSLKPFAGALGLMPATLRVTSFAGDINLVGKITLSPSSTGTVDLIAAGAINGLQSNGLLSPELAYDATSNPYVWGTSVINLSDADPNRVPGVASPAGLSAAPVGTTASTWAVTQPDILSKFDALFNESGATTGASTVLQTQQALHDTSLLHAGDTTPVHLYAAEGDISGLTLFAGKSARVIAGNDITDLSVYVQNNTASDVTVVAAGRDLVAYDPNSPLRLAAVALGNQLIAGSDKPTPGGGATTAGDIQVGGQGTVEVLAGRNFDLGVGTSNDDGTAVGLTTIGNARNPALPFGGADIIAAAGIGPAFDLEHSQLDFAALEKTFLNPATGGTYATRYLADVADILGMAGASADKTWAKYAQLATAERDNILLTIFYLVLRDAGRDHNNPASAGYRNYDAGYLAVKTLFPGSTWTGDMSLTSREIKTTNGGDIAVFAPGGALTVGYDISGNNAADQGILTAYGGSIDIFTRGNVNVGTSRIFTLRGGNEIIWSSTGNIAAGASSKTVQSAPPTRVLVDPQSGDVKTDLAGLATGGGIGVLATVAGVPPGDVDLIAPTGVIDAGDAGIRVSGNINIAAVQVLNASNVQSAGSATGVPAVGSAPALGGALAAVANTAAAAGNAAAEAAKQNRSVAQTEELPSIITVEVVGYGGGDGAGDDNKKDEDKPSGD